MTSTLDQVICAYQESRARGNEIWEIYEGQPNPKGATEKSLERLQKKLGRALPKDYAEFLRKHDGWEGYEYDRSLLSAKEILDDVASDSIETNMDNMDEDAADDLEKVFVIGLDNGTATILYYDTTKKGEPELVEHYVDEQGRWPSLTAYFESLRDDIEQSIAAEQGTKASAVADWEPAVRQKKEETYHAELKARWQPPAKAPAIPKSFGDIGGVPSEATELTKNQLRTYLGFCGYLLYLPTAAEVTAAAVAFRRHFPWTGKIKACAPSDEYGAVEIASDATDYSQFLAIQSGGHFGLRMVDEAKGEKSARIFNLRGAPKSDGESAAPFLEVLVPANADPGALRAFVLDLADVLPLAHGFAGYIALPSQANWRENMQTLYAWCRAHWGLEIALADEMIPLALHGLHGASWLTLLDHPTGSLVRSHLPKRGARVHERKHAMVIEAGDAPSLGDVRLEYPKAVAAVHNVLAPLMAPGIKDLRHFDDQGGTTAWWHRFEDPAAFAVGATNIFDTIKAAYEARDAKKLQAAMAQLEARPKEVHASLHQSLSDLALQALRARSPLALVLYEHLTSGKDPHPANLCNAVLALEKTTDPKVIDRFIDRALPAGKKMPSIFHNVIWRYTQRGDTTRAIATFKQAAPHYTVELSKFTENDKDLAELHANPKFAAIQRDIKKRLGITSEWSPLARNPELEKKVGENPDKAAAYRQYAKWLTKAGDPRGALIEAHLEEDKNPRSKTARGALKKVMTPYIRNRLQARFPKLSEYFKADDFRWGVLDRIYFNGWNSRHHAEGLAFLADPECLLLRTVYFNSMTIDLADLAQKIPWVQELNLTKAKFPTLEPIGRFAELEELRLIGTDVKDLEPLRGLTKLRKLYLGGTAVTDLEPIKDLPALELVSLEGSSVTNIKPLFELPRLCELWLYKTKISKADSERIENHIKARPEIKPGPGVTRMVYGP